MPLFSNRVLEVEHCELGIGGLLLIVGADGFELGVE
jgi:hypothetical protein